MITQRGRFGILVLLCMEYCNAWNLHADPHSRIRRKKTTFHQQHNSISPSVENVESSHRKESTKEMSPLSLNFEDLSAAVGGSGRAKDIWECYRKGDDPFLIDDQQPSRIGERARRKLEISLDNRLPVTTIATLVETHVSQDNTTKLLLRLTKDQLEVEAVIIPWKDRKSSTLCVSSQVGCRQACRFCQTGTMGLIRSLSAEEILAQLVYANKICQDTENLYIIDNLVFMGMGEPADNIENVLQAANIMTDHRQFALAPRKVTISTVAPTPLAFKNIAKAPVVLAWSIHSANDEKRRLLVPTARFTLDELRTGLLDVLQSRSRRLRAIMLEVTLLDGINDSLVDAEDLVMFCQPLGAHAKVVVNLIPWNPTTDTPILPGPQSITFRKPRQDKIRAFQDYLVDRGLRCYIRKTRGDDERAACGQLATDRTRHHTKLMGS